MRKYYDGVRGERNILYTEKGGRLIGLDVSCVGIVLLKHVIEGKIEGGIEVTGNKEKDVSSC
jgi:hypothetical protein